MRKKHYAIGLVLLATAVVLSGCMTTFASDSGRLAYAEVEGEAEGQVDTSESFMYIIHPDLVPLGDKYWENVDLLLDPQLEAHGGDAVTDLEIRYGFTAIDYILSAFVPIINWGTIEAEGTAVSR